MVLARISCVALLPVMAFGCVRPTREGAAPSGGQVTIIEQHEQVMVGGGLVILPDRSTLLFGKIRDALTKEWNGIVTRIDQGGTTIWQVIVPQRQSSFRRGVPTKSGGAIAVGEAIASGTSLLDGPSALVAKIGPQGQLEWATPILPGTKSTAWAVTVAQDDIVAIAGIVEHARTENTIFIAKVTMDGMVQWQRDLGAGLADYVSAIRELQGGGFILGGYFGLARVDVSGHVQWRRESTDGGEPLDVAAIVELPDGDLIAGGSAYTRGGGGGRIVLTRLRSTGSVVWVTELAEPGLDSVIGIWLSPQGGATVGARSSADDRELWLGRFDLDGRCMAKEAFRVAPGAVAFEAELLGADLFVAGGMFSSTSPDAGKLWLFMATPQILWRSVAGGC
jgi:hypothetical protein